MTGDAVRIGSLFSGYGGLEQGVSSVLDDVSTAWTSDIDLGACKILAHRYPGVPNLGDITRVDWTAVEPVDILTGGFPCQDVSHAGKRAGLRPDTRSGLWSQMAYAIDTLRPRLVVVENVRGLLSAEAASDVEPCPWCMGGAADGEPALRALGAVLGDLADLGYDARWVGLRAADVGAPHGRFRVFVVAWPQPGDAHDVDRAGWPPAGLKGQARSQAGPSPDADSTGRQGHGRPRAHRGAVAAAALPTTDPTGDGRDEGRPEPAGVIGGPHAPVSGSAHCWYCGEPGKPGDCWNCGARNAPPADPGSERHGRREDAGAVGRVDGTDASEARQRERPRGVTGDRGAAAPADADRDGLALLGRVDTLRRDPHGRGSTDIAWGDYEPAIRRWEAVLGRPAPAPTEPGKNGARLSPRFVEWMQGLSAGWVCDVPGLTRNEQLKALGNGVVPQQAAAAVRIALGAAAASSPRALEVPKPPPPPAGVDALFDLTPTDPTERTA